MYPMSVTASLVLPMRSHARVRCCPTWMPRRLSRGAPSRVRTYLDVSAERNTSTAAIENAWVSPGAQRVWLALRNLASKLNQLHSASGAPIFRRMSPEDG